MANRGSHEIKREKPEEIVREPRRENKNESDMAESSKRSFKKKMKRIPKWVRVLVIVLLALLIIGGAIWAFIDSKFNLISYNSGEDTPMKTGEKFEVFAPEGETLDIDGLEERESGSELPSGSIFADKDVINILLLGTDMKIPNTNDPGRCDCTMICSLNRKTGDIKLVSFERAIGVPVPNYEDEKLSYVFQYGGGDFMQETVKKCFLVDLAGYVHVGYEMFPAVIDAIGGIDIELTKSEAYNMSNYLKGKYNGEPLHEGTNHLNGIATYSYCRLRDADDDWHRQGRTRETIAALVSKLKTLSIKDLNKMLDTVLPMVETNISKSELKNLMTLAPKFINADVSQLMMPDKEKTWSYVTGRGAYMIGCDYTECAKEIKDFLYSN